MDRGLAPRVIATPLPGGGPLEYASRGSREGGDWRGKLCQSDESHLIYFTDPRFHAHSSITLCCESK